MSWEKEPLWTKAKLYFERGFTFSREDPQFGLWCALGLELLARAALASVSPTLLAASHNDHRFLLHALGRGSKEVNRRSIPAVKVFELCKTLFPRFSQDNVKAAMALVSRRNEELHSGAAAFEEYPCKYWLAGFYACCDVLTAELGETLDRLFGTAEAHIAREALEKLEDETINRVTNLLATHKTKFLALSAAERKEATAKADKLGRELSHQKHHRVSCPACGCVATVQGDTLGSENISYEDDKIIVRQAVSPRIFSCPACSLRLSGHAELKAASLATPYTRTSRYSPEEYYGLIHPDDTDTVQQLLDDYLRAMASEYDNE